MIICTQLIIKTVLLVAISGIIYLYKDNFAKKKEEIQRIE